MTRRSYFDVRATSPDGRWRLEALSADNGNELVRDGAPVQGESLGAFQRNFRYRLIDTSHNASVWEHWQDQGEGSPVRAWVSTGGHVVVWAHYLDWSADQLLFFTRAGEKALVVVVATEGYDADARVHPIGASKRKARRRLRAEPRTSVWRDSHVMGSTAGPLWAFGSLLTFPSGGGTSYASLRTAWGRRLVVDLEAMTMLDDGAASEVSALIEAEERRHALDDLAATLAATEAAPDAPPVSPAPAPDAPPVSPAPAPDAPPVSPAPTLDTRPLSPDPAPDARPPSPAPAPNARALLPDPEGALGVVIAQRLAEAAPLLRRLEACPATSFLSSCRALGEGWCHQSLSSTRALTRLALRAIGEEPSPGGNYRFFRSSSSFAREPDGPEAPAARPDRARDVARSTAAGATAADVLATAGPPELIRAVSRQAERFYVWSELWDYDGPDGTTTLAWSFPESTRRETVDGPKQVVDVVDGPPAWADGERLLAILGYRR